MRLFTILSFFLFGALSLSIAQPTLTGAKNTNKVGDQYIGSSCDTTGFDPGASGANVSWNYASLNVVGTIPVNFVDPINTSNGSSFPTANLAATNQVGGQSAESFLFENNQTRDNLGAFTPIGSIINSNPQTLLKFPFTFKDAYIDTFASSVINSIQQQYNREGVDTVTADAYGTLTTPAGTFNNVLRVYTHMVYKDIDPNFGFDVDYDEYRWEWYGEDNAFPLLTYSRLYSFSFGIPFTSIFSLTYVDPQAVSIESLFAQETNLKLGPNPATEVLNLSFELKQTTEVSISLYNHLGQKVRMLDTFQAPMGGSKKRIELEGLVAGIYILRFEALGNSVSKNLMIK